MKDPPAPHRSQARGGPLQRGRLVTAMIGPPLQDGFALVLGVPGH